jgi:hypothetical protein
MLRASNKIRSRARIQPGCTSDDGAKYPQARIVAGADVYWVFDGLENRTKQHAEIKLGELAVLFVAYGLRKFT